MYLPKPGDAHVLDLFSLKGKVAVVTGMCFAFDAFEPSLALPSPIVLPEDST